MSVERALMDDSLLSFRSFWTAVRAYHPGQVAIELILIGAVVWWVITFLRGTRGARMLKGVAFVLISLYLIVRLVGTQFGLTRIEFLYRQFLIFASVATVVVFQPELRRALMRLGETRLFRSWSSQVDDEIDALVEAAQFLSRRKIGALVAIERDVGLGGIAESGTRVGAELSAPLLETLFWPNSPLHDLGVIVSGGKIAYAGVQFPLAESGDLERELGSRHRAAVGMSQESDAVVLVVSEETGDVSIAERGQLIRKLTPEGLRGLLSELLGRGDAGAPMRKAAVLIPLLMMFHG
ncbi:MAG: diadenylate cyclase [Phycisphaerales bacterium]|jgi:diadenylate cyclase|nr:diadenylate cyclase [Phycisphaerales bacterium]